MAITRTQKTARKPIKKTKESNVSSKQINAIKTEDSESTTKTEPDPIICKAGEPVNLKEVDLTKTINKYCKSFKMNLDGYNMYECLGITPDEFDEFKREIKRQTGRSVRKAEKVNDFVNAILDDKTKIATLVWLIIN